MRIIVNDTSVLIDLRKAGLLAATLLLPHRFQVALPLVHTELLDFTRADFEDLATRGLEIVDLDSGGVGRAIGLRRAHPSLSINDCFSLALAESQADAMLLTGDQDLRRRATQLGVEVHGVLWATDAMETHGVASFAALLDGLERLHADPVVFLPVAELQQRIHRLQALVGRG